MFCFFCLFVFCGSGRNKLLYNVFNVQDKISRLVAKSDPSCSFPCLCESWLRMRCWGPLPPWWKTFLWDWGLLGTLCVLHVLAAGEWSASAFIKLQNKLKTLISVCGVDNRVSASSYNNLAEANGFTLSRVSRFQLRVLKAVRSFPRVLLRFTVRSLGFPKRNILELIRFPLRCSCLSLLFAFV